MDARRKLKAKRKLACTGRSGRVEERFRALVEQGNYYEAHQTMRALYQRFLAQGKKDKAIRLLRQASVVLLEKRQVAAGIYFIDCLQNYIRTENNLKCYNYHYSHMWTPKIVTRVFHGLYSSSS